MSSPFKSPLHVRVLAPSELLTKRQSYELTAPFTYTSAILGDLTVPAGFHTDFASIPRIAWRYIDPEDPAILFASVIHDYLYSLKGVLPTSQEYTRKQADEVLVEAMAACGARWDQRKIVYAAVRVGGGTNWS